MKVVLQRCLSASVTVDSKVVSSIKKGILVLAGIGPNDTQDDVESMALKIVKIKMWEDGDGKMWKKSVADIEGEILCGNVIYLYRSIENLSTLVSQFTLYASTKKGNKPSFHGAAGPETAKRLYEHFFAKVQQAYNPARVKDGVFQAMMEVALVNDGPVTLQMENGTPQKPEGQEFSNSQNTIAD